MIRVNRALCAGCGLCVDECSARAISLSGGIALVDPALCNSCDACVEICPVGALESTLGPLSLAVVQTPVEVIPAETRAATTWRQAMLPLAGATLAWVGREVAPRLALLALDAFDGALSRRPRIKSATLAPIDEERGRGRQGRRRRRGRRRRGRRTL